MVTMMRAENAVVAWQKADVVLRQRRSSTAHGSDWASRISGSPVRSGIPWAAAVAAAKQSASAIG
jgi:hypothetical protein